MPMLIKRETHKENQETKEIPKKREIQLFSIEEIIRYLSPRYHHNTGYAVGSNTERLSIANMLSKHHHLPKNEHPHHHIPPIIHPKQLLHILTYINAEKKVGSTRIL